MGAKIRTATAQLELGLPAEPNRRAVKGAKKAAAKPVPKATKKRAAKSKSASAPKPKKTPSAKALPPTPSGTAVRPPGAFACFGAGTVAYQTTLGTAVTGDSREVLRQLPDESVDLIVTSPPYALHFKKEYGNVDKKDYVAWFLDFAREFHRVLKPTGSFVLNIGGSYNAGSPTRSLYHFKLLVALCDEIGFHLAQEFFWHNPAKLPAPAEWVTVRRIRVKDSVEYVWWLSKTEWPKADNRNVLAPYSEDMQRLIKRGYKAKKRPSGHNITHKFQADLGGAIPPSLITRGNNESNSHYIKACQTLGIKVHPARYPSALPEFFAKLLTSEGDMVVDPFAGSNTTGRVAEDLARRWLSIDVEPAYVQASAVRFGLEIDAAAASQTHQLAAKTVSRANGTATAQSSAVGRKRAATGRRRTKQAAA